MKTAKLQENALLKTHISRSSVAKLLGVTHSYVTRLIHNNTIPQPDENGLMELEATVIAYIEAVRPRKGRVENKGRLLDVNYDSESSCDIPDSGQDEYVLDYKHELLKEDWRKRKRENDEAEGMLVSKEDVSEAVGLVVSEILPVVENLHYVALKAWPDLPPAALESIQGEVARAVNRAIDSVGEWL